ncbi:TonB-dependent receptor [Fodinibius salsisoli]|uniref:TonB-dependent receptor n=1 Tax=Fodinibius salsisoli TaxID=2820877 RepID=A0ABT3PQN9_9BACT|nr:TonB-dependent receptor [Fodinibius salsisoli]MCW9708175.1 TonB-dependent receptor [Fodinibius salsisoli]
MRFIATTITLFLMIAGSMQLSHAQTYQITGQVTGEKENAIKQARIFLAPGRDDSSSYKEKQFTTNATKTTFTDSQGTYKIQDIKPGSYTITAFYTGKKITSRTVQVENQDVRLNFKLTILAEELEEITVNASGEQTFGVTRLNAVEGVTINDAKKNEVVLVDDLTANLATNNSRQVYSKVPGLNIWESDAAGVQLGIGGRGLSPNRSSNFNTRQNGYDIAADALGYPESYYTPPTQAIERIKIIRGAASLQYGTQFGGLLNFVFKKGPRSRPFEFNSEQTVGSFGLFSSFNSIGGKKGKVRYYGFYQYKQSNGWRPNSDLDQHAAYGSVQYQVTPKLSISPEYTHMQYLAQQPGGLTDTEFDQNPRQSNRERNWFRVNWNLFALTADYKFSSKTRLNTRFFGLKARREALGNLGRIDRADFGGNRDLLKDDYNNWGNETRLIHRYPFLDNISVFLIGTRLYNGFTHRRQGDGNDGSGPDFNYLNPDNLEGSNFDLPSSNQSVFIENIFNITPKLSITPGIRFEHINTEAQGYYRNIVKDLAGNVLVDDRIQEERQKDRSFLFYGLGVSYKESNQFEIYANYSQNYRAINFNDIRVDVGSLKVDPNISDEHGYNADFGIRGQQSQLLNYDISLFHLSYEDRIGTILKTEPNPNFNNLVDRTVRYRTNIADAKIYGFESFAELDLYQFFTNSSTDTQLSIFSNLALTTGTYSKSQENGVEGNRVELVPKLNLKTGLTFAQKNFKASYQFSYVSEQYSDASNARRTPSAIEGIIPAYYVVDFSVQYSINRFHLESGINNLTNNHYFTRRATGYPGPGIIPSTARSFYLTIGITL